MSRSSKIFVLDTSVILYDHNAIKNFEEHDVVIPIHVIEEIDNFKKGNETVNFEARAFIRFIDTLSNDKLLTDWIPLNGPDKGSIKVVLDQGALDIDAVQVFDDKKYDHRILNTALLIKSEYPDKRVILVSKDTCLRLKAKSLNVMAEDYETGKIKDVSKLFTGKTVIENIDATLIDEIYEKGQVSAERIEADYSNNHFFILKNHKKSALVKHSPKENTIENVGSPRAYGIKPKNAEQTFALHALLNPDIKLITIQGQAGTGKTLLALAAALEQRKDYRQIFVTRPIIPLSNKDIGYLPGDVKSKLDPYMEPLWDNLKYIKGQFPPEDKQYRTIEGMIESEKIAIAPLAYIRGRSLSRVFFIVDEAQNLTPHEIKTIISRAGEDTKIAFMGDIMQIDTPYLDSESNGLSYLIDKVKSHKLYAHITLEKGERSELANLANDFL